jgi:hypothetical protein
MGMKEISAYLLLALGGNASPDAAAISAVISAGGGEADSAQVELLLKELEGKVCTSRSTPHVEPWLHNAVIIIMRGLSFNTTGLIIQTLCS